MCAMKRLAALLVAAGLSLGAFGDSMQSGEVTRLELVDGGTGTIQINNGKYFIDDSATVLVNDSQVRLDQLQVGYDVQYELTYPLGSGAFIKVIRITGPKEVIHDLLQE